MRQGLSSRLIIFTKGFCMGAADVVPGVSGGTMAYVLGLYPQLLAAINSFDWAWFKCLLLLDLRSCFRTAHFHLLIPLGLGIVAAVLFFTRVVPLPLYLSTYPERVYALFFGLIVGSIIVLWGQMPRLGIKGILQLSLGVVFGYWVVTQVPTATPDDAWFVFMSGALAITAMILPGISGSFILLILGKYAFIFDAIGHFNLHVIVPFALGAATGLMLFSRFLAWLLKHFHSATLFVINGFLIASLWVIWPFQNRTYVQVHGKHRLLSSTPNLPDAWDPSLVIPIGLLLLGIIVVIVISSMARRGPASALG